MAVWIPVTVVPTSLATVAIDTFMTELSRVIRNCPEAKVSRTSPAPRSTEVVDAPELTAATSVPPPQPPPVPGTLDTGSRPDGRMDHPLGVIHAGPVPSGYEMGDRT